MDVLNDAIKNDRRYHLSTEHRDMTNKKMLNSYSIIITDKKKCI